ncbi:hypothetical protein [Streptomyces griseus]|uniref:hypothetical protein n=1 Tax=Streptomyces griseus TaxID=1911 RepID=UPI0036CC8A4D
MKLSRVRYGVGAAAVAMSVVVLSAGPASAAGKTWYRDCAKDTKYVAKVSAHEATTTKSGGSCAGHAWVRIKVEGSSKWGTWADSNSTAKRISPVYKIVASEHKDCNCSTANKHTLKP